jgi:hypothetical protein
MICATSDNSGYVEILSAGEARIFINTKKFPALKLSAFKEEKRDQIYFPLLVRISLFPIPCNHLSISSFLNLR